MFPSTSWGKGEKRRSGAKFDLLISVIVSGQIQKKESMTFLRLISGAVTNLLEHIIFKFPDVFNLFLPQWYIVGMQVTFLQTFKEASEQWLAIPSNKLTNS